MAVDGWMDGIISLDQKGFFFFEESKFEIKLEILLGENQQNTQRKKP